MSGIPRIDKTIGLALLACAKMQHRENVLLKSVETHALKIGHRNRLRVAVALAAATAWIVLAGNSDARGGLPLRMVRRVVCASRANASQGEGCARATRKDRGE